MRTQSIKEVFARFGTDQPRTPALSRAQRLAKVAPPIVAEALERRRMLSVSTSSFGDILTVTGDGNANKIDVWFDGDSINVWVNNTPHSSFNDDLLTNELIVVYGGAGNDTINCYGGEDVYNVPFPCRLYGDDGNDSIEGSDNADTIYGGAGYDTVRSWDAADSVFGGSGFGDNDDSVTGGDLLYGDAGNDVVRGEGGADTIYGGNNADTLYGGDSEDYLHGGEGADIMYGDDGDDTINATDNDDATDILYGGNGNDCGYWFVDDSAIDVEGQF